MTGSPLRPSRRLAWPWPLPALLVWAGCWLPLLAAGPQLPALAAQWHWPLASLVAVAVGLAAAAGGLAALAWPGLSAWRRGLVGLGFPVSALASGWAAGLPGWAWLLPLGLLLLAYPMKAWRDAPLFPTPAQALDGLAQAVPLPAGASVLDAGCGLGHGLAALHRQYPQARLQGVEWSWPLAWATRLRCRFARVQQGDLWRGRWQRHALVYVFQRPESMARVWAKACAEMAPGSWLVSLDFAVPDQPPHLCLQPPGARQAVWVYRIPPAAQPGLPSADKPAACPTPLRAV